MKIQNTMRRMNRLHVAQPERTNTIIHGNGGYMACKRLESEKYVSHCLAGIKKWRTISTFVKDAVCSDHCLGRCIYIHGVPGTGKAMSVLAVMTRLRSEFDSGALRPYCFITNHWVSNQLLQRISTRHANF